MIKPLKAKLWKTEFNQSKQELKKMKNSVIKKMRIICWIVALQINGSHTCQRKAMEEAAWLEPHQSNDLALNLCIFRRFPIRIKITIICKHRISLLHSLILKNLKIKVRFHKICKIKLKNLIQIWMTTKRKLKKNLKTKLHRMGINK